MKDDVDDVPLFTDGDEGSVQETPGSTDKWVILIVDDEEGVHSVSELALGNMRFDGKGMDFLHAYSGAEAREILADRKDVAVILLDVVMETEHEGLEVADYIRNQLDNHRVRIVLRTGQPGQAPEEEAVVRYDINDYKEKTELTYRKLFSTVYTALRSYRDIMTLERNRVGLEKVIDASSAILEEHYTKDFAQGVLEQLAALMHLDEDVVLAEYEGAVAEREADKVRILAHVGTEDPDHPALRSRLHQALLQKQDLADGNRCIRYIRDRQGLETAIYLTGKHPIQELDRRLLDIFCRNVSIAFDNVRLNDSLRETQSDIVYSICELAETRSKETGNHVRRVAYYSKLMAEELGLAHNQIEEVFMAAPLHDVGKIGIPDAILNKPGKLDADEWEIMKTHATIGSEILSHSIQPVMQAGALIAGHHHENWDGSGYPGGLSVKISISMAALLPWQMSMTPWRGNAVTRMPGIRMRSTNLFSPNPGRNLIRPWWRSTGDGKGTSAQFTKIMPMMRSSRRRISLREHDRYAVPGAFKAPARSPRHPPPLRPAGTWSAGAPACGSPHVRGCHVG